MGKKSKAVPQPRRPARGGTRDALAGTVPVATFFPSPSRALFGPHKTQCAWVTATGAQEASGNHNYYAREPSTVRARVGRKGRLTARTRVVMLTVIDTSGLADLEESCGGEA